MPDFEEHGYSGMWLPSRKVEGETGLLIVIKRRYDIDLASGNCEPSDDIAPVRYMDELRDPDDPMKSSVIVGGDMAAEKDRVDIVVRATAYAPKGKAVPSFEVGMRIGRVLDRRLRVSGPRVATWVAPKKMVSVKDKEKGKEQEWPPPIFSEPAPIDSLPLVYEHAYGGEARIVSAEEDKENAAKFQDEAEKSEERRKRKKEIELEMIAEEEAAAAKAKEDAEGGPKDAETEAQVAEAFGGNEPTAGAGAEGARMPTGGTQVLDAEMIARLDAAVPEHDDAIVSPYRLGRERPAKGAEPAEADTAEADAEHAEADADADADAVADAADEASPFTEGTGILDISALEGLDARDELRAVIADTDAEAQERARDEEGTHRERRSDQGDVQVTDGGWVSAYINAPKPKKKAAEDDDETPKIPYPGNPSGRGYCVGTLKEAIDGVQLPCIEELDAPLTPENFVRPLADLKLTELSAAAGMGAYPGGWFPRASFAGIYEWDVEAAEKSVAETLKEYDPEDPDDAIAIAQLKAMEFPRMKQAWFQQAHPRMQVERIDGDEDVLCENLTPDGHLFFRLPGQHPSAFLELGDGAVPLRLRLDTLWIDLDDAKAPAVELTWRAFHPVKDVDAAIEGAMERRGIDVRIWPMDMAAWRDAEQKAEAPRREGTAMVAAMDDEDLEGVMGEQADIEYRDLVDARQESEGIGAPKDEHGTSIIDLSKEHQVVDGEWDGQIRDDKEAWEAEQLAKMEVQEKERLLRIRKAAREKADAEFDIDRDGDDDGKKKKKKKGKKK